MRRDERALLDHMLSIDFAGVTELRQQAEVARVRGGDLPWNVHLYVPETAPAATVAHNPVTRATSRDLSAPDAVDVSLWLDTTGRLSSIDVAWFDEGPATDVPRPDLLSPPSVYH